jgi:hypothetical protein
MSYAILEKEKKTHEFRLLGLYFFSLKQLSKGQGSSFPALYYRRIELANS